MSMLAYAAQFTADLGDLWANADANTTVYDTADLIEDFWGNCEATGYPQPANQTNVIPQSSYPGFAGIAQPLASHTPAIAAQAFETGLTNLCLQTTFVLVAPPSAIPPTAPLPGGTATPGLLTTALTAIFTQGAADGASTPTAPLIAAEVIKFLNGWICNVLIPPATSPAPIPII